MNDALERLIKARVGLLAREPFFGHLAMSKLELVEDVKCKSSWTDGRRIGFNPEFIASIGTIDELETLMAHHVATCALGHPFRRGTRDDELWQQASDHCVNDYLKASGFRLPEGATYDPQYAGMYVEQIYSTMYQQQQGDDGNDGKPQQGAGAAPGGGAGASDQPTPNAPGAGRGDPADGPADGTGAEAPGSDSPTGEVRDASGEDGEAASDSERSDQEADWRTAVAQAAQAARGAGKLSGDTERLATAALEPLVSWTEALQRVLKAKARDDYSMRRPNKRFMPFGIIAPSLDSTRCGPLGFAIDYSSSIRQQHVDQFTAEVEDARQTVKPERVIVVIFTSEVRQVLEFEDGEPIVLPPVRSGGGTDFAPPIRVFNELPELPDVVVYLTDLDCRSFAPEPEYPVVWVTTQPGQAPYGEIINMY